MEKILSCGYWKCAHRVGLFLAALFVICFGFHSVYQPDPEFLLKMFQSVYLGFTGMDLTSFLLGAIQTYIWAYIGVGIWYAVGCCHNWDQCQKE
ncbi:hypothetical protein HZA86_03215 [Candidatus Uhrbacteria bacterium]|nr:hypothetical protein [Candidatus Uhrbacteria bacterium]